MGSLSVRGAALAAAMAVSFTALASSEAPDRWAIGHGPVAAVTTGGVESPERPPRPPRAAGTPSKPNARAEWFYSQRAYPLPEIPVGALGKAQAQAAAMPEAIGALKASSTSPWTLIGPVGFDSRVEPTWGRMSGRVRAIALDPNDGNRILLGTATGGVWLSSNAGQSWTPLTDQMPSLAIGAVAIDPNNANVFYAGSGEANGSYYSAGLYKSTDGGASWQVLAADTFRLGAIASILVDPANSNFVLVCARNGSLLNGGSTGNNIGGVYRSTDGGQSFQQVFNSFCTDLVAVPTNFNVMYTSAVGINDGNGLYRSTDRGQSFSRVEGAVSGSDVGRLAIGLSRDGSRVYIGGDNGNAVVLQRSLDGGTTWSPAVSTPKPDGNSNEPGQAATYCESQCGYDNAIGVDPFDGNVVWLGGIGLFRSGDAMENFARIGSNNTGGGPLHVDHHVVAFHPTVQGLVYNGNDGGIYRSTDGGASWASIGGTLATIQSYHVALHPTDPNILYTGNQDNGTTQRNGNNVWTEIVGGDGGYAAVNFNNPQIVYASTTNLNFNKSTDGGQSFQPAGFQRAEGEPVGFIAPVVMNPANPDVLVGGTNRLWQTSDGAANWQPVSEALPFTEDAVISAIAFARNDPRLIYAGASDGTFARQTPEGTGRVRGGSLPERYLTSIAADASNPLIVYATFSGFNQATPSTPGHVFRSTDGGSTWANVSGNLPDAPVNAVVIRPGQTQEVYVGTDVGVYITLDGGGSWAKMGNGLPNVAVASMAVNGTTDRLVAATYGRSVWSTTLSGGGTTPPPPPGGALDEPSLTRANLPAPNPPNQFCPAGYFTATVTDGPGEGISAGLFGVELLLDDPGTRQLEGGLNFGGLVDVSQVGFAGANIANATNENQRLNVSLTGAPSTDINGVLPVRVTINRRTSTTTTPVFSQVANLRMNQPFETSIEVEPGYYEALVAADGFPASAAGGAPEGQFFFSLTTSFVNRAGGGFQGGAVVGGYHAQHPFNGVSGFAGFCISTPHTTSIRVFSAPSYGPAGARDLRLRVIDGPGNVIHEVPGG